MPHTAIRSDDCDIKISRIAMDAWLAIPWCQEKWQILALLKCEQLPFCDVADNELYVVIPPDDDEASSPPGIDVTQTCVDGEYSEVTPIEELESVCALRVGAYVILFRHLEYALHQLCEGGAAANLKTCFVAGIIRADGGKS